MENFNPSNPEYKKVEDLPKEEQGNYVNHGDGFIRKGQEYDLKVAVQEGAIPMGELSFTFEQKAKAEKEMRYEKDPKFREYLDFTAAIRETNRKISSFSDFDKLKDTETNRNFVKYDTASEVWKAEVGCHLKEFGKKYYNDGKAIDESEYSAPLGTPMWSIFQELYSIQVSLTQNNKEHFDFHISRLKALLEGFESGIKMFYKSE